LSSYCEALTVRNLMWIQLECDVIMRTFYRVAPKYKSLPNDQKIVLKPANEIRFIRQIKV